MKTKLKLRDYILIIIGIIIIILLLCFLNILPIEFCEPFCGWANCTDTGGIPGSIGTTTTILTTTSIGNPYTCGEIYDNGICGGTCPDDYECLDVEFGHIAGDYVACVCVDGSEVHPDWKPNGDYHQPVPDTTTTVVDTTTTVATTTVFTTTSITDCDYHCNAAQYEFGEYGSWTQGTCVDEGWASCDELQREYANSWVYAGVCCCINCYA